MGTVFVGTTEGSARIMQEALKGVDKPDLEAIAARIVAELRARTSAIPGIGHPVHKPIDPRTPRLFQLAKENGYYGNYCELIQAIAAEAERVTGKVLPVNATGAIGAVASSVWTGASAAASPSWVARSASSVTSPKKSATRSKRRSGSAWSRKPRRICIPSTNDQRRVRIVKRLAADFGQLTRQSADVEPDHQGQGNRRQIRVNMTGAIPFRKIELALASGVAVHTR